MIYLHGFAIMQQNRIKHTHAAIKLVYVTRALSSMVLILHISPSASTPCLFYNLVTPQEPRHAPQTIPHFLVHPERGCAY